MPEKLIALVVLHGVFLGLGVGLWFRVARPLRQAWQQGTYRLFYHELNLRPGLHSFLILARVLLLLSMYGGLYISLCMQTFFLGVLHSPWALGALGGLLLLVAADLTYCTHRRGQPGKADTAWTRRCILQVSALYVYTFLVCGLTGLLLLLSLSAFIQIVGWLVALGGSICRAEYPTHDLRDGLRYCSIKKHRCDFLFQLILHLTGTGITAYFTFLFGTICAALMVE